LGAAAVVHDIGASAGPSVRREIVMIITDPAAAVTRYIDAVRDGDSSAIRECFAEDATWDYPGDLPLSGTWRGRDSIVDDFLGSVGPALEPGSSVALEVTNVLSVGDQVVAEWTSRATARGGAAYHNRNVGIFTVRDGKITAVREYTDTQHAAHVLFGQPFPLPNQPPRPARIPPDPAPRPARIPPDPAPRPARIPPDPA